MHDIAIIPARSGSKGLRDKNIQPMLGKPLIAYTIQAALQSGLFARVFVSTDSQHYADIAQACGAAVPFLRSQAMSGDRASSWDTVEEVLGMWEARGESFDRFALLQPTSPLRTKEDLIAADRLYSGKRAKAIVSVCAAEHALSTYNLLPPDLSMTHFLRQEDSKPRQLQQQYYRLNGAIYLSEVNHFRTHTMIYDADCYALVMDTARSVDIDTQLDFDVAEFLMEKLGVHR